MRPRPEDGADHQHDEGAREDEEAILVLLHYLRDPARSQRGLGARRVGGGSGAVGGGLSDRWRRGTMQSPSPKDSGDGPSLLKSGDGPSRGGSKHTAWFDIVTWPIATSEPEGQWARVGHAAGGDRTGCGESLVRKRW